MKKDKVIKFYSGITFLSLFLIILMSPLIRANLIASYSFNEGSGTSLADSSSNDNTGTIFGAGWTEGKYGNALHFDGINDYVSVANSASLNPTDGITISAWVKADSNKNYARIVDKYNSYLLESYYNSNDKGPCSIVNVGGLRFLQNTGITFPVGEWIHLATTYNSSKHEMKIYYNGNLLKNSTFYSSDYSISTTTNSLNIGRYNGGNYYFNGLIDEIRIYNRALNQTEIQNDMNTPVD